MLDPGVMADSAVRERARSLLQRTEFERWRRLRFEIDGDEFLATRLLVRTVLAGYTRCRPRVLRFRTGAQGKPELVTMSGRAGVQFNLSNTQGLVACAVTCDRPVGVDAELLREVPYGVANDFFARPEIEWLQAAAPDDSEAFFGVWTLKESFIKARGGGVSMALDGFAVGLQPPRLLPYGEGISQVGHWSFLRLAPTPRHRVAVCVRTDGSVPPALVCRWLAAGEC